MGPLRGVSKRTTDERRVYPNLNARKRDSRSDMMRSSRNARDSGNNTESSVELVSDFEDSSYFERPAIVEPPIAQSSPGNRFLKTKNAFFGEVEIVKRIEDLVKVELASPGKEDDEEMDENTQDLPAIYAHNVKIVESIGDDDWIYE